MQITISAENNVYALVRDKIVEQSEGSGGEIRRSGREHVSVKWSRHYSDMTSISDVHA